MISLDSIEQSILELESSDTSFSVCERLAWLYVVRDHLRGYDEKPTEISLEGSSDFLLAVNGKNPERIMPIINDLMDAVRVLHPNMYEKVISKLKDEG